MLSPALENGVLVVFRVVFADFRSSEGSVLITTLFVIVLPYQQALINWNRKGSCQTGLSGPEIARKEAVFFWRK